MPWDLVSDAAMGEKNAHFRSQKQVRRCRAAATNTSTKTTTAVRGVRVVAGQREENKLNKKEAVNKVSHRGCT